LKLSGGKLRDHSASALYLKLAPLPAKSVSLGQGEPLYMRLTGPNTDLLRRNGTRGSLGFWPVKVSASMTRVAGFAHLETGEGWLNERDRAKKRKVPPTVGTTLAEDPKIQFPRIPLSDL